MNAVVYLALVVQDLFKHKFISTSKSDGLIH